MSEKESDVGKGQAAKPAGEGSKSKLIASDAAVGSAAASEKGATEEPQYVVDGEAVTREEYMAALPKAGYVPGRMPANHYPAINTK